MHIVHQLPLMLSFKTDSNKRWAVDYGRGGGTPSGQTLVCKRQDFITFPANKFEKKDDATVLGASFCIGTILGTYQSNQVTTVNFVNCCQPSIITLDFSPTKIHGPPFCSNQSYLVKCFLHVWCPLECMRLDSLFWCSSFSCEWC